jgi:hypothetical protein
MADIGHREIILGATKSSGIEQAGYEADIYAHRSTEIPSNLQARVDYDVRTDGQAVYMGWTARGLAENLDGWLLHKLEYDAGGMYIKRTIAYDSWANRASASYA